MRLSEDELVSLVNLMLNDLEHSRWVVLETYGQKEQLGANKDLITKVAGRTLSLAIAKAVTLDKLVAKTEALTPNDAGMELIEFWLDIDQVTREDEANDT